MGVMNLTPNSFSDGAKLNTQKAQQDTFQEFIKLFDILDIGAESTAPFNEAIGATTELERLEDFFYPLLDSIPDPQTTISIDTYRPEVFYEIALILNKLWPRTKLVFNDISGKTDADLRALLTSDIEFDYVFSHNLCVDRAHASDHMNYLSNQRGIDFVLEVRNWFQNRLEFFSDIKRKLILDPCFGFSKTREQNYDLLRNFSELFEGMEHDVLIGVSRKSFMRFPQDLNPKSAQGQLELDCLQTLVAQKLLETSKNDLIFRTHNSASFAALSAAAKIF